MFQFRYKRIKENHYVFYNVKHHVELTFKNLTYRPYEMTRLTTNRWKGDYQEIIPGVYLKNLPPNSNPFQWILKFLGHVPDYLSSFDLLIENKKDDIKLILNDNQEKKVLYSNSIWGKSEISPKTAIGMDFIGRYINWATVR